MLKVDIKRLTWELKHQLLLPVRVLGLKPESVDKVGDYVKHQGWRWCQTPWRRSGSGSRSQSRWWWMWPKSICEIGDDVKSLSLFDQPLIMVTSLGAGKPGAKLLSKMRMVGRYYVTGSWAYMSYHPHLAQEHHIWWIYWELSEGWYDNMIL